MSDPSIKRKGISFAAFCRVIAIHLCLISVFYTIAPAMAVTIVTKVNGEKHAGDLVVARNQSQVLRLDVPFAELLVGNSKIADVLALTDRSIYVLGKELGTTSLMIYGKNKELIAVLDVVVSHDIDKLKSRLFEVMPTEKIEVRDVNGSLMLSGALSSSAKVTRALAIAAQYAPAPSKVINAMSVTGSQQVMLAVRFAEVARTVVKELGLNTNIDASKISISSGDALISGLFAATSFITGSIGPFGAISFLFDALEERGLVKTLAEPNLIALSGDTASFLAGGEFPVPVAQATADGGTTVTVEFKEFGVSLSFTPTVLENGLINIVVSPEVSKIDRANSVTVSGFNIPGLTTRRATTTVELRDGQSFAIAGLIQSDFQDTIREVPLLAKVPILGALLRSTDFQRNETELVIIVTPHLVKPAEPGTLKTPVDNFVLPSDADMFLYGRTEANNAAPVTDKGTAALTIQGAGGLAGQYGHILR